MIGGWIADSFIGQRLSVIIGGLVMAARPSAGMRHRIENQQRVHGRLVLIIGNRFQGQLRRWLAVVSKGDIRRDSAFAIFYMGINLGAFIAPICSTLGEDAAYGWKYGFMAAGFGMLLGGHQMLLSTLSRRSAQAPGAKRSWKPAASTLRDGDDAIVS